MSLASSRAPTTAMMARRAYDGYNPTDHESGVYYHFLFSMSVDPYSELRKIPDMIGANPYVADTTGFVSHPYLF